jgi:hypothetical protein
VFEGDHDEAYDVLGGNVRLDFPVVFGQSTGEVVRRKKFRSRHRFRASARGYALLAVSAYETGHLEVARQAMEHAEERGVDMESLKTLLAS